MGIEYSRQVVRPEFAAYKEKNVRFVWSSLRHCRHFCPHLLISFKDFQQVFRAPPDEARVQLHLFDQNARGLVPAFDILGGILIVAKGDAREKIKCAFSFFDVGNKGKTSLTKDELVIVMECAMRGMGVMRGIKPPEHEVYENLAQDVFNEFNLSVFDEMSHDMFADWFKRDLVRTAILDAALENVRKLGTIISRQRNILSQMAEAVAFLEAEGVENPIEKLDLGPEINKAAAATAKALAAAGSQEAAHTYSSSMEAATVRIREEIRRRREAEGMGDGRPRSKRGKGTGRTKKKTRRKTTKVNKGGYHGKRGLRAVFGFHRRMDIAARKAEEAYNERMRQKRAAALAASGLSGEGKAGSAAPPQPKGRRDSLMVDMDKIEVDPVSLGIVDPEAGLGAELSVLGVTGLMSWRALRRYAAEDAVLQQRSATGHSSSAARARSTASRSRRNDAGTVMSNFGFGIKALPADLGRHCCFLVPQAGPYAGYLLPAEPIVSAYTDEGPGLPTEFQIQPGYNPIELQPPRWFGLAAPDLRCLRYLALDYGVCLPDAALRHFQTVLNDVTDARRGRLGYCKKIRRALSGKNAKELMQAIAKKKRHAEIRGIRSDVDDDEEESRDFFIRYYGTDIMGIDIDQERLESPSSSAFSPSLRSPLQSSLATSLASTLSRGALVVGVDPRVASKRKTASKARARRLSAEVIAAPHATAWSPGQSAHTPAASFSKTRNLDTLELSLRLEAEAMGIKETVWQSQLAAAPHTAEFKDVMDIDEDVRWLFEAWLEEGYLTASRRRERGMPRRGVVRKKQTRRAAHLSDSDSDAEHPKRQWLGGMGAWNGLTFWERSIGKARVWWQRVKRRMVQQYGPTVSSGAQVKVRVRRVVSEAAELLGVKVRVKGESSLKKHRRDSGAFAPPSKSLDAGGLEGPSLSSTLQSMDSSSTPADRSGLVSTPAAAAGLRAPPSPTRPTTAGTASVADFAEALSVVRAQSAARRLRDLLVASGKPKKGDTAWVTPFGAGPPFARLGNHMLVAGSTFLERWGYARPRLTTVPKRRLVFDIEVDGGGEAYERWRSVQVAGDAIGQARLETIVSKIMSREQATLVRRKLARLVSPQQREAELVGLMNDAAGSSDRLNTPGNAENKGQGKDGTGQKPGAAAPAGRRRRGSVVGRRRLSLDMRKDELQLGDTAAAVDDRAANQEEGGAQRKASSEEGSKTKDDEGGKEDEDKENDISGVDLDREGVEPSLEVPWQDTASLRAFEEAEEAEFGSDDVRFTVGLGMTARNGMPAYPPVTLRAPRVVSADSVPVEEELRAKAKAQAAGDSMSTLSYLNDTQPAPTGLHKQTSKAKVEGPPPVWKRFMPENFSGSSTKREATTSMYKSFVAIDFAAKDIVQESHLRRLAMRIDALLSLPFVHRRFSWLFHSHALRIQQQGSTFRLRVLLFRRDDCINALSPFLGADFVNIVTDKATEIKMRMDIGISKESLEAIKLYAGYRSRLAKRDGEQQRLTLFGRRAAQDLFSKLDTDVDGFLNLPEFNYHQLASCASYPPAAAAALPRPPPTLRVHQHTTAYRAWHRFAIGHSGGAGGAGEGLPPSYEVRLALESPLLDMKKDVLLHASKERSVGALYTMEDEGEAKGKSILDVIRVAKQKAAARSHKPEGVGEPIISLADHFPDEGNLLTYPPPWLPPVETAQQLLEAFKKTQLNVHDEGAINLFHFVEAYAAAASGGWPAYLPLHKDTRAAAQKRAIDKDNAEALEEAGLPPSMTIAELRQSRPASVERPRTPEETGGGSLDVLQQVHAKRQGAKLEGPGPGPGRAGGARPTTSKSVRFQDAGSSDDEEAARPTTAASKTSQTWVDDLLETSSRPATGNTELLTYEEKMELERSIRLPKVNEEGEVTVPFKSLEVDDEVTYLSAPPPPRNFRFRRGDGGKELARDVAAHGIGTIAEGVRLRCSVIAEVPETLLQVLLPLNRSSPSYKAIVKRLRSRLELLPPTPVVLALLAAATPGVSRAMSPPRRAPWGAHRPGTPEHVSTRYKNKGNQARAPPLLRAKSAPHGPVAQDSDALFPPAPSLWSTATADRSTTALPGPRVRFNDTSDGGAAAGAGMAMKQQGMTMTMGVPTPTARGGGAFMQSSEEEAVAAEAKASDARMEEASSMEDNSVEAFSFSLPPEALPFEPSVTSAQEEKAKSKVKASDTDLDLAHAIFHSLLDTPDSGWFNIAELLGHEKSIHSGQLPKAYSRVGPLLLMLLRHVHSGNIRSTFSSLLELIPKEFMPRWLREPGKAYQYLRSTRRSIRRWYRRTIMRECQLKEAAEEEAAEDLRREKRGMFALRAKRGPKFTRATSRRVLRAIAPAAWDEESSDSEEELGAAGKIEAAALSAIETEKRAGVAASDAALRSKHGKGLDLHGGTWPLPLMKATSRRYMRRHISAVDQEFESSRVSELTSRSSYKRRSDAAAAPPVPARKPPPRKELVVSSLLKQELLRVKEKLAGKSGSLLLAESAFTSYSSEDAEPLCPPEVYGTKLWLSSLGNMKESASVWEEASMKARHVVELIDRYLTGPVQVSVGNANMEFDFTIQDFDLVSLLLNGLLDPDLAESKVAGLRKARDAAKEAARKKEALMKAMEAAGSLQPRLHSTRVGRGEFSHQYTYEYTQGPSRSRRKYRQFHRKWAASQTYQDLSMEEGMCVPE